MLFQLIFYEITYITHILNSCPTRFFIFVQVFHYFFRFFITIICFCCEVVVQKLLSLFGCPHIPNFFNTFADILIFYLTTFCELTVVHWNLVTLSLIVLVVVKRPRASFIVTTYVTTSFVLTHTNMLFQLIIYHIIDSTHILNRSPTRFFIFVHIFHYFFGFFTTIICFCCEVVVQKMLSLFGCPHIPNLFNTLICVLILNLTAFCKFTVVHRNLVTLSLIVLVVVKRPRASFVVTAYVTTSFVSAN